MFVSERWVEVGEGGVDALVERVREVVASARALDLCLAFDVTADVFDPSRVLVRERWVSRQAFDAFHDDAPLEAALGLGAAAQEEVFAAAPWRGPQQPADVARLRPLDDAALALLWLNRFDPIEIPERGVTVWTTWKQLDWDVMNRLHEAGWISDPIGKRKSLTITPAGGAHAEVCLANLIGGDDD
jgi:quinol monooxygenase YgiN